MTRVKKRLRKRVTAAALGMCMFASSISFAGVGAANVVSAAEVSREASLVKNGDFEQFTDNGIADWEFATADSAKGHMYRSYDTGHNISKSVLISNSDFTASKVCQTVQLKPNTEYDLSVWIKKVNVTKSSSSNDVQLSKPHVSVNTDYELSEYGIQDRYVTASSYYNPQYDYTKNLTYGWICESNKICNTSGWTSYDILQYGGKWR